MKKIIFYISFVFAIFSATAQVRKAHDKAMSDPKMQEKIKALYTAYISQQLALTPAEAEKFWPTHAQYQAELMAINKNELNELEGQQAILNVKKKYQGNFNKILGIERSNSFYKQDEELRKKLIDRLKKMKQQRANNNTPGRLQKTRKGRN